MSQNCLKINGPLVFARFHFMAASFQQRMHLPSFLRTQEVLARSVAAIFVYQCIVFENWVLSHVHCCLYIHPHFSGKCAIVALNEWGKTFLPSHLHVPSCSLLYNTNPLLHFTACGRPESSRRTKQGRKQKTYPTSSLAS